MNQNPSLVGFIQTGNQQTVQAQRIHNLSVRQKTMDRHKIETGERVRQGNKDDTGQYDRD